jgi:hypothetical protein
MEWYSQTAWSLQATDLQEEALNLKSSDISDIVRDIPCTKAAYTVHHYLFSDSIMAGLGS